MSPTEGEHIPRTFRDPFSDLFAEVRRGMLAQLAQLSFQAVVVTYDGGTVSATVTRIGATVAEGPYRVAPHVGALIAGQRVYVQDISGEGGFLVVARV